MPFRPSGIFGRMQDIASRYREFLRMQQGIILPIGIFLIAPLLVLTTWQSNYSRTTVRDLSLPVLLIELSILLWLLLSQLSLVNQINKISKPTIIIVALWICSALFSTAAAQADQTAAFRHFFITLLHLLFGFAVWGSLINDSDLVRKIIFLLSSSLALFTIIVVICAASVFGNQGFDWISFGGGITNVRQLGFFGLGLSGLAAGLWTFLPSRCARNMFTIYLTMGIFLVFWSGGRAAVGGLTFQLILIFTFVNKTDRIKFAKVLTFASFVAIPLSIILAPSDSFGAMSVFSRIISEDNISADRFTSGRVDIWLATIDAILLQPWFGYGEAQFKLAVPLAAGYYNHPHMYPLQLLFQWGLIGTLLFGCYITRLLRKLGRAIKQKPSAALPCLAVLVGLMAMSMLEGPFFWPYPAMLSAICLAILASLTSHSRVNDPACPDPCRTHQECS